MALLLCVWLVGCGVPQSALRDTVLPAAGGTAVVPTVGARLASPTVAIELAPTVQPAATIVPSPEAVTSPTPPPSAAQSAAAAGAPVRPAAPRFTNDNWSAVLAAPSANRGASVSISGRVFNLEQDAARDAVQIWTDPAHQSGNTVVVFARASAPAVKLNDVVQAEGTLDGELVAKDAAGQTVHLPRVQASRVSLVQAGASAQGPASAASASAQGSASASPASVAAASAQGSASAAAASVAASARPPAGPSGIYRVAGSGPGGLAVRGLPGTTQPKLGVVHDGDLLNVVGPAPGAPGWVQVLGAGFSGFVSLDYLTGPVASAGAPLASLGR